MKSKKICSLLMIMGLVMSSGVLLASCGTNNDSTQNSTQSEVKVSKLNLDTSKVKTEFDFNESFSYDGLKVTAEMSDGTTKDVSLSDCKITEPNMELPGRRVVLISYSGQTARYQITVKERVYPTISETSLLNITGENESVAYRVEAENIDMTNVKKGEGVTSFVKDAPEGAEITGGGKYLTSYGVKYNYFGFTFNSDKEYTGITLVFRMAYSGSKNSIDVQDNLKAYMNREVVDGEEKGKLSLVGSLEKGECTWKDIVIRNVTLKEGTNTLTFDALSNDIPDIDYIDFYVGMRYISSVAELTEGTLMKDLETFDTEYASTREDWANANPDKIVNGLGLETVTKESEGKTTSGGKSVAALNRGSQLSTTMRLAKDSTIKLEFIAAKVDDYKVKENWEFYIDGFKLELVEDRNIKGGNAAAGEYWDWIATDLGSYNLTEGDHFFLIKNTGSDCNIDGVQFTVVSSGSYDESGSALDNQKKPEPEPSKADLEISADGEYKIEAENLDKTNWVLRKDFADQGLGFTEAWSNDFGSGTCARAFTNGTVITATIEVKKAIKDLRVGMRMSYYENETYDFSNTTITFAGQTLTPVPAGTFGHRADGDFWKWVDVSLGKVDLEVGTYTFSMTTNGGFNLDYFSFSNLADSNPEPEPEPEPDTTITKAGETRIEAENLDLSKLTLQPAMSSNTEVDSKNPSNYCVCGMNVNSVLSFTFKLDIDANVQISALMAKYESSFSTKDKLEVKLNDTTLAVEEKNLGRAEDGTNDWHNWIDVKFGGVQSLSAGTYTLTLKTLTDSNANIDCFILNTTVSE